MKYLFFLFILFDSIFAISIVDSGNIKIDSIEPNVAIANKNTKFLVKGSGFTKDNKVSITPSIMNRKNLISSLKISNPNTLINYKKMLYIGNENGVVIFDIDNYEYPKEINFIKTNSPIYNLSIYDNYLYIVTYNGELKKIDLTNLEIIKEIKLNGFVGNNQSLIIENNKIYISYYSRDTNSVKIFDLELKELEFIETKERIKAIYLKNNELYVATKDIEIFDLKSKDKAIIELNEDIRGLIIENKFIFIAIRNEVLILKDSQIINKINIGSDINFIDILNDTLYVTTKDSGVKQFDIKDINLPIEKQSINIQNVNFIKIIGKFGFLLSEDEGLAIFEANPIENFLLKAKIDTDSLIYSIDIQNNILVSAEHNGVKIYDISNLKNPTLLKTIKVSEAKKVLIKNNLLFIADYDEGFKIIDIKDISNINIIGNFDTDGLSYDLDIKDNIVFIADGENGIEAIDISIPSKPIHMSNLPLENTSVITINGDKAYIGDNNKFKIIDISTPEMMKILNYDNYETSGFIKDIKIKDEIAFVAVADGGLDIINVSMSDFPFYISSLRVGSWISDISIDESIAYLADESEGVIIVDISDIYTPFLIDTIALAGVTKEIKIDNNSIFTASYRAGINIIDKYIKDLNYKFIDENQIEVEFPNYQTLGDYSLRVFDKQNYSKAYGAITLISEIQKLNTPTNNLIFSIKDESNKKLRSSSDFYQVDEKVSLNALLKNDNGDINNVYKRSLVNEYKVSVSDSNIAEFNYKEETLIFKHTGIVTVTMQANGVTASIQFQVGNPEILKDNKEMIIIVGTTDKNLKEHNDEVRYTINKLGNDIYKAVYYQGVSHQNIHYFNPNGEQKILYIDSDNELDDVVDYKEFDFDTLKEVLESLNSNKPLYIYIIDHGEEDKSLYISNAQRVYVDKWKELIDEFQQKTNREVVLIVEACYSGNLIETLKGENRVIITSANNESAKISPKNTQKGFEREVKSFSNYFIKDILKGKVLNEAFYSASSSWKELLSRYEREQNPQIFITDEELKVIGEANIYEKAPQFIDYSGKNSNDIVNLENKNFHISLTTNVKYTNSIEASAIISEWGSETEQLSNSKYETLKIDEVKLLQDGSSFSGNYTFEKDGVYILDFVLYDDDKNEYTKSSILIGIGKTQEELLFIKDEIENKKSLVINKGWNLKAIPTNEIISDFSIFKNYSQIWIYKNSKWILNPEYLKQRDGFWIKSNEYMEVEFSGDGYKIDINSLSQGWNLVGSGEELNDLNNSWVYRNFEWISNPKNIYEGDGFWIKK